MYFKLFFGTNFEPINYSLTNFNFQLDGPKFIKELPSHQLLRLNENLNLKCEIDSNPSSSITWSLNGTYIYSYPVLTINSINQNNYGVYTCTASLKDFQKVSSSTIVLPPGSFSSTLNSTDV
jgi:hypothetical protein